MLDEIISSKEELVSMLETAHNECLEALNGSAFDTCDFLYHYTSVDACASILKNSTLRFTHVKYLNDPNEIKSGLDILVRAHKEVIDKYKQENNAFAKIMTILVYALCKELSFPSDWGAYQKQLYTDADYKALNIDEEAKKQSSTSVFIACFSQKSDDLRQWLPYAKNGEGAVLQFEGVQGHHNLTNEDIHIVKACYEKEKKKEQFVKDIYQKAFSVFKKIDSLQIDLYKLFNTEIFNAFMYDIIACKTESYVDEEEWRLICILNKDNALSRCDFFIRDGVARPYVDVKINKQSVRGVCLGPKAERVLNANSFDWILKKYNYNYASEVNISTIPYRG